MKTSFRLFGVPFFAALACMLAAFILLPNSQAIAQGKIVIAQAEITEKEAYEAAKELGTIEAWEAFLNSYSKGFRADLARAYLKRIASQAPKETPATATPPPPPPPAVVAAPPPPPPPPPSPADISITETANQANCKGGDSCSYTMVATNTGGTAFAGQLVIANSLSPRGAKLTSTGNAPWFCEAMGGGAVCTNANAIIEPGASTNLSLTFTLPRRAGGSVTSCASISWGGAPTASGVIDVQAALNARGHNVGRPDGQAGRKTVSAIRSYQTQNGLQATGEIDLPLLISLFTVPGDGDTDPNNDQACAGSAVTAVQTTYTPTPQIQYCGGGRIQDRNGKCACPATFPYWTGKTCIPRLTRNCTGGRYYSKKNKLCLCPSRKPYWYNNRCYAGLNDCPGDSVRVGNQCIKDNEPGIQAGGSPRFGCKSGQIQIGNNCISINLAPLFGQQKKSRQGGGNARRQGTNVQTFGVGQPTTGGGQKTQGGRSAPNAPKAPPQPKKVKNSKCPGNLVHVPGVGCTVGKCGPNQVATANGCVNLKAKQTQKARLSAAQVNSQVYNACMAGGLDGPSVGGCRGAAARVTKDVMSAPDQARALRGNMGDLNALAAAQKQKQGTKPKLSKAAEDRKTKARIAAKKCPAGQFPLLNFISGEIGCHSCSKANLAMSVALGNPKVCRNHTPGAITGEIFCEPETRMVLVNHKCICPSYLTLKGKRCVDKPKAPTVTRQLMCRPGSGMVVVGNKCACPAKLTWNGKKCIPRPTATILRQAVPQTQQQPKKVQPIKCGPNQVRTAKGCVTLKAPPPPPPPPVVRRLPAAPKFCAAGQTGSCRCPAGLVKDSVSGNSMPCRPACTPGKVRIFGVCCVRGSNVSSGHCCPSGHNWKGNRCVGPGTKKKPPAVTRQLMCRPGSGMVVVGNKCACPAKLTWNGKKCIPQPTATIMRQAVPQTQQQPKIACSGGGKVVNGRCVCPANRPRFEGGKCKKPKGNQFIQQQQNQPQTQPQTKQQKQQQQIQQGINQLNKLFSDIRLKQDVEHLTTLSSGIKLYSFRYLWSDTVQVGVMAQDLLADPARRDAVSLHRSGYYMVDYQQLGLKMVTLDEWNRRGAVSVRLQFSTAIIPATAGLRF